MYRKSLNHTFQFLLLLLASCSIAVAFSLPIPATFVKVKSTKISNGLYKALKDQRPELLKELEPQGGEIFSGALSILKNKDAILILRGQTKGPKVKLEQKVIDSISSSANDPVLIIVKCECRIGAGACIYRWSSDFLQGCENTDSTCQDCLGTIEIVDPNGPIIKIPF